MVTNEAREFRLGDMAQEMLEQSGASGKESFVVSDYWRRLSELPDGGKQFSKLTEEVEDAIIGLVDKFKREKVIFEDFKSDNIYIRQIGRASCRGKSVDL